MKMCFRLAFVGNRGAWNIILLNGQTKVTVFPHKALSFSSHNVMERNSGEIKILNNSPFH